jgi:hypothetical protein
VFSLIYTLIMRVKNTRWYIYCCLTKTLPQGTKPNGKNKTLDEGKSTTYQYDMYSRLPLLSTTPPDLCINQGSLENILILVLSTCFPNMVLDIDLVKHVTFF